MRFRTLTWNIHKCIGGLDRRYDPARTAAVIAEADADLCLLQEVAQRGTWYRGERQVDVLADLLGYEHRAYFVNVSFGPKRGDYGNAILSRFPIGHTANLDLTLPGKKTRSALHAEIRIGIADGGHRTLHVYNLHLGLGERERREQLRRLLASGEFQRRHRTTPVVVGGDFNDVFGTMRRRLLLLDELSGAPRRHRTFPAFAPMRALDAIFVGGHIRLTSLITVRSRRTRAASDHLPLLADLQFTP